MTGGWREQSRQAEQRAQTRSLPVSATRRRRCGGVPRCKSTKYWPAPDDAPDTTGAESAAGGGG